jgi:hypothetical protein
MTIIGKEGAPKYKVDEHNDVLDLRGGQRGIEDVAVMPAVQGSVFAPMSWTTWVPYFAIFPILVGIGGRSRLPERWEGKPGGRS